MIGLDGLGRRGRRAPMVVLAALACAAACAAAAPKPDGAYLASGKLAREMVARGDWERAFGILDELHRQHPEDAEVLTLRGIVYRERGLYTDAEADLRAALAVTPASAETHAALGILYDVQLRPDAEPQHREAVRLAPNNPAYLNNLGFSLYLRQHFKEAIAEYEKAARLAPLSHRVRTNLGFACAANGDLRRAAREFRMGGSESEAMNNLGFAYERRGDLNNAYDMYLEAIRVDPAASKARSNLVHAASVLGRPVPTEAQAPAAPPTGSAAGSAPTGSAAGSAPTGSAAAPSDAPAAAESETLSAASPSAPPPAKMDASQRPAAALLTPTSPQQKAKP